MQQHVNRPPLIIFLSSNASCPQVSHQEPNEGYLSCHREENIWLTGLVITQEKESQDSETKCLRGVKEQGPFTRVLPKVSKSPDALSSPKTPQSAPHISS
jgi:hypothetical protein